MTASQSREMALNNENNNQSTVNQKTVNLTRFTVNNQQVETSKQIARINNKIFYVETWVWRQY
jgi:hypothetical protein